MDYKQSGKSEVSGHVWLKHPNLSAFCSRTLCFCASSASRSALPGFCVPMRCSPGRRIAIEDLFTQVGAVLAAPDTSYAVTKLI